MFLMKPEEEVVPKYKYGYGVYAVLLMLAVPTMYFGIFFSPLVKIAEVSAVFFGIR